MILGTPPYMSPEQFTGGAIRRQSDIYSLGIILYEMLTAKLPFDADSPWAWAQRHLAATPPELPPDMPPAVVATVRSALAKNPDDRPSTTLEFLSRLYARDATILARGPLESKVDPSRALQPGDTQRDPEALSVATARGLRSAADTTARGSTQGDETRLPRAVKTAAGNGAPPNAWLPRAIPITVAPAPRRIARRRSWFAPVATLLAIGVVASHSLLTAIHLRCRPASARTLPPQRRRKRPRIPAPKRTTSPRQNRDRGSTCRLFRVPVRVDLKLLPRERLRRLRSPAHQLHHRLSPCRVL
jgi:hypothetical protein